MDDLISRQAAIDALDKRFDSIPMEQTTEILLLRKDLRDLPSAQPETNCSEFPNNSDTISRQAAIDALIRKIRPHNNGDGTITMCVMSEELVRKTLDDLPSAQPEIVRCGDCKYFKVEHGWNCSSYPICEVSPQRIITPDDYCSFAERRTDENNNE